MRKENQVYWKKHHAYSVEVSSNATVWGCFAGKTWYLDDIRMSIINPDNKLCSKSPSGHEKGAWSPQTKAY